MSIPKFEEKREFSGEMKKVENFIDSFDGSDVYQAQLSVRSNFTRINKILEMARDKYHNQTFCLKWFNYINEMKWHVR